MPYSKDHKALLKRGRFPNHTVRPLCSISVVYESQNNRWFKRMEADEQIEARSYYVVDHIAQESFYDLSGNNNSYGIEYRAEYGYSDRVGLHSQVLELVHNGPAIVIEKEGVAVNTPTLSYRYTEVGCGPVAGNISLVVVVGAGTQQF